MCASLSRISLSIAFSLAYPHNTFRRDVSAYVPCSQVCWNNALCARKIVNQDSLLLRGGKGAEQFSAKGSVGVISSDLSSDLSGFVSTIFFSDEDDSYKCGKQLLPVSDLNSSLAEQDLREIEDPALPLLGEDGRIGFARTGREYLKFVRREAEALNIKTSPTVKHVILTKTGAYIPYDLDAEPSDSVEDVHLQPKAIGRMKLPAVSRAVSPLNSILLDIPAFLGARERVHDWRTLEHHFFHLRNFFSRRRSSCRLYSPAESTTARRACLDAMAAGSSPRLHHLVPLSDEDLLELIDSQTVAAASERDIGDLNARLRARWLFAFLVAIPALLSDSIISKVNSICAFGRARLLSSSSASSLVAAAGSISALDVVIAAARALGRGHQLAPQRRQRGQPPEPSLTRLLRARWGDGLSGPRAHVVEGGRAVWINGESTVLSEEGVQAGRWYAGIKVLHLASKDAFVGVCLTARDAPMDLGCYLPEIGYGVRGGVDKGRRKSLPQYCGDGRAVANTGTFVRNFRAGQLLGLIIDADHRQVEYYIDGTFQGAVFTDLPPIQGDGHVMRWAVSNGWKGSSAYAFVGICRLS